MKKLKIIILMSTYTALSWSQGNAHAVDRVVVNSLHADRWYDNVFLMADKIDWMTFRNFTVQIGDQGQYLYHFPTWESGKYYTYLFRDDLDGNKFTDVIIVLDNYTDPIHVLQQEPYKGYKEVPVESIDESIKRLVKMEKKGDIVTITTKQKTYKVNVKPFHYSTAKPSSTLIYGGIDHVNYSVQDHKLIAVVPVLITIGGGIGDLKFTYNWTGKGYEAKSVSFQEAVPIKYDTKKIIK